MIHNLLFKMTNQIISYSANKKITLVTMVGANRLVQIGRVVYFIPIILGFLI
jgi:hypothetical protein